MFDGTDLLYFPYYIGILWFAIYIYKFAGNQKLYNAYKWEISNIQPSLYLDIMEYNYNDSIIASYNGYSWISWIIEWQWSVYRFIPWSYFLHRLLHRSSAELEERFFFLNIMVLYDNYNYIWINYNGYLWLAIGWWYDMVISNG